MKPFFQICLLSLLFLGVFGCGSCETGGIPQVQQDTIRDAVPAKEFGQRYSVVGDFNGDKTIDTVYESYISLFTNKETDKVQDSINWENNIDLIIKNKPVCRLYASIPGIDTFVVTNNHQHTGIFHLRNLGDVNNDGKDEIGYAINWADFSNMNHYHIVEIESNKFVELFDFRFNESMLYGDQEGLFENGELVKQKNKNTILYIFQSDSATIETGEHTF